MTPAQFRDRFKLSQLDAAGIFAVTPRAWQHWEVGARTVPGPARVLLRLLERRPELLAVITSRPCA